MSVSARMKALAVLVVLALAGCASPARMQRPGLALPDAYPTGGASQPAEIPADWWKLYGDETLNALVASSLERHPDARLAAARIEEADAALREAGAAFLPQVDLAAGGSRSQVSRRTAVPLPATAPVIRNNVRINASTAFELDFWGRLANINEAARAQALASRFARDVTALTLSGAVTQAWFSLRSLDAQIAVTGASVKSRAETLDMVRKRARAGLVSDLDVNQATVAARDAQAQLAELERQRALVANQLGALSGRLDLVVAPAPRALDALPLPPAPPAGLPSALLERRPDVRQAEEQLAAAHAQVAAARAAMLPAISLTAGAGAESRALATLLSSGAGIWSLGFGLALPIFDNGRLAARADAAGARERQALASYQRAAESAFREVADALANTRQYAAAEEDLAARAEAARGTLRLAERRYAAGYSAYLEVLDAQRTANEAELALIRNRQARLAASVDLMKALGGGWKDGG